MKGAPIATFRRASMRKLAVWSIGAGLAAVQCATPALLCAAPAPTVTAMGVSASCIIVNAAPDHARSECDFPTLSSTETKEIRYVSLHCGRLGGRPNFMILEFQVLTNPPNLTSPVAYQIPIPFSIPLGSSDGVIGIGSPVALYVKAGTGVTALIDFQTQGVSGGSVPCTVSLSAN
jgi:hypothetical protein